MSFTRQHITAGQQASIARSFFYSTTPAAFAMNRSLVSICPDSVGSRSRQYEAPGACLISLIEGSKPSDDVPTQIQFTMKITGKSTGTAASDKQAVNQARIHIQDTSPSTNEPAILAENPSHRTPESPEVESLRSLLKANLDRLSASPALIERIRSGMHSSKD